MTKQRKIKAKEFFNASGVSVEYDIVNIYKVISDCIV